MTCSKVRHSTGLTEHFQIEKIQIAPLIGICFDVKDNKVGRRSKIANFEMTYRKVASSNIFRLKAHAGFFRLLMKGIFDPYVL